MMRWLAEAEPQLETIDTFNAESNDHMVARQRAAGVPRDGARAAVPDAAPEGVARSDVDHDDDVRRACGASTPTAG